LNLVGADSPVSNTAQRDSHCMFLYANDLDQYRSLSKVLPLETVLKVHDVWIAGLRRDQTGFRNDPPEKTPGLHGTIKFHKFRKRLRLQPALQHLRRYQPVHVQCELSSADSEQSFRWTDPELHPRRRSRTHRRGLRRRQILSRAI